MKRSIGLLVFTSALVAGACSVDGPTATARGRPEPAVSASMVEQGTPTGIHIVQYAPGTEATSRASVTVAGGSVVGDVPQVNMLFVRGLTGATASSVAATSGVESVAEDRIVNTVATVASATIAEGSAPRAVAWDPSRAAYYAKQWNMRATKANLAWPITAGGLGERVCVLSTGIDSSNIDLAGGLVNLAVTAFDPKQTPRFPSDLTPFDYNGAGTMIAAIIASRGLNFASVAPNAKLCSIKVASQDGAVAMAEAILGLVLAGDAKADVISVGFDFVLNLNTANDRALLGQMNAAVAYAHYKGSAVVAPIGDFATNLSLQPIPYLLVVAPAMIPGGILAGGSSGVIGVGATAPFDLRNFDLLAPYSNRGTMEVMDLVAPGGRNLFPVGPAFADEIWSACSHFVDWFACGRTGASVGSGSIFAAAMVSGAAAVVESAVRSRSSEQIQMTPAAIGACLRRTADKVGPKNEYGAGRVNVLTAALSCNRSG